MEWTIRAAETLWTGMLVHLWQTTLVLLVLFVLSRALVNAPARLISALWWIGVLKLFLPLSLLGPLTANTLRPLVDSAGANPSSSQEVWVSVSYWLYPQTLRAPVEPTSPAMGMLYLVMTLAWLTGLGWILSRRIRRSMSLTGVALPAGCEQLSLTESKIADALAPTAVPREAIVIVEGTGVPAVRGLLRPRIELPARVVETLDVDELTAVLLHEEEHRRRRDPLRSTPAALASWLFFFYPPLRWVLRQIHETTEMACDEAVLRFGVAPQNYARAIARTLAMGLDPAYTRSGLAGPCRSSFRNRLARLNMHRRYRTMPRHRLTLTAAVVIALVGSVAPLTPGTPGKAEAEKSARTAASTERFDVLDRLEGADRRVTLAFEQAPIEKVLESLSHVAVFELKMHSSLGDEPVTIVLEDVTLREALIEIAGLVPLSYMVPNPGTLWVGQVFLAGVDGITAPQRIDDSAVTPVYPEEMRLAKLTGRVILQAIIDETGRVSDVEVLSTNQPDYPSMIDSAREALEQWRYLPATRDGNPVSVYFTVVVEYDLDQKKSAAEPEGEPI